MNIHSGSMSYLNKLHKQYGVFKFNMKILKKWSDDKYTVSFEEKENEVEK
jgi:hypothetical protein